MTRSAKLICIMALKNAIQGLESYSVDKDKIISGAFLKQTNQYHDAIREILSLKEDKL